MLVVTVAIPPAALALEYTLDALPSIDVEAERIAAHSTRWTMPCLWMSHDDLDAVDEALHSDPSVDAIVERRHFEDDGFYNVDWSESVTERIDAFTDKEGSILQAHLQGESWRVVFRFADREQFDSFRDRLDELGHEFRLLGLNDPETPREAYHQLTAPQRDALVAAATNGYFGVPRETTISELADEIGISHQSFSERLRRGMENLVFSTLTVEKAGDR